MATSSRFFSAEAAAAVRVWNASTAYNHCWLVMPIAAWLAWIRRHRLAMITPYVFLAGLLIDYGSYPLAFGTTGLITLLAVIPWLRARETHQVPRSSS